MFDRNPQSRKSAAITSPPARDLGPRALAIIARLPRGAVPHRTYLRHPQVVARLLAAWPDPQAFRDRLDTLLLNDRGHRQGFDFGVIRELTMLREHYDTQVQPIEADPWERAGRC